MVTPEPSSSNREEFGEPAGDGVDAHASSRDCFCAGGDRGEICRLFASLGGVDCACCSGLNSVALAAFACTSSCDLLSACVASKALERIECCDDGFVVVDEGPVRSDLADLCSHVRLQKLSCGFLAIKLTRHSG